MGGCQGRANFRDLEIHLEWWWNLLMDGWVDGPAIQSDFLKSGLPSYTVGVSVGKDCSGRFVRSWTIEHLVSPIVTLLCSRCLEPPVLAIMTLCLVFSGANMRHRGYFLSTSLCSHHVHGIKMCLLTSQHRFYTHLSYFFLN